MVVLMKNLIFNNREHQGVTVIIPAYNEGPRIKNVIEPIIDSEYIQKIIVVDDCSSDDTYQRVNEINSEKLKIIRKEKNAGKTLAMKTGIDNTETDYILFLDADLTNIILTDIEKLIVPVISKKVDVTMSIRKNSLKIYKMLKCDFVSGERCLNKNIIKKIFVKPKIGFGIEVLMNDYFIKNEISFVCIPVNFSNTMKSQKQGMFKGFINEFKMIIQIFKAVPFYKVIFQMFKMSKISKRYRRKFNL